MTHLIYAESNSYDPYFNLSFEKFLFDNIREDEVVLYLWQNESTVVCGRNQNIYKECNLTALEEIGGKVARRLSGGGAVFHDLQNLNFSFIAHDGFYDVDKQLEVIKRAVESFGLTPVRSGRNDLTIDDRKFSGNAFFKANGRNCHHGTIMVDVDRTTIEEVLLVDNEKLKSKGVASVKSRVTNLHSLNENIDIDSLKKALLVSCLKTYEEESFDSEIIIGSNKVISATGRSGWIASGSMLTMLQELSEGRDFFADKNWIYGRNPAFENTVEKRFDWGSVEVCTTVKADVITNCKIFSDSLIPDFISAVEEILVGREYSPEEIKIAIDEAKAGIDDDVSAEAADLLSLFL